MNCHEALLSFFSIVFGSGLWWSHVTSTYDFQEIGGRDLPGILNITEMAMAFLTLTVGTLTFFGAWCDCPILQKNLYMAISGMYGVFCTIVLAFLIARATLKTHECASCPLEGLNIQRRDECIVNGTDWSDKNIYADEGLTQCWYFACDQVCVSRHPKLATAVTVTGVSVGIYAILTLISCVCMHDKKSKSRGRDYGAVALNQTKYEDDEDDLVVVTSRKALPKNFSINGESESDSDDGDAQSTAV